jgi:hypothetical protein
MREPEEKNVSKLRCLQVVLSPSCEARWDVAYAKGTRRHTRRSEEGATMSDALPTALQVAIALLFLASFLA